MYTIMRQRTYWTENMKQWMRDNYATVETEKGAEHFGIDISVYRSCAFKMGLKKPPKYVRQVKMDLFSNIKKPEVAYFLGLVWADGNVTDVKLKTKKWYSMRLAGVATDIEEIEPMINDLGEFGRFVYVPKPTDTSKKTQIHLYSYDQRLTHFLVDHDYRLKSRVSPTKILAKIPPNLHHHFWHGFFDGDGCIYHGVAHRCWKLTFCGAFDQDWSDLVAFAKTRGVEMKPRQITTKVIGKCGRPNRFSDVGVQTREKALKLLEAMMSDNEMGYSRKRARYKELKQIMQPLLATDPRP